MHKNHRDAKCERLIICFKYNKKGRLHEQSILEHTTIFLGPGKYLLSQCPTLEGLLQGYSCALRDHHNWLDMLCSPFWLYYWSVSEYKQYATNRKAQYNFIKMKQKWEKWGLFHFVHKSNLVFLSPFQLCPGSSQTDSLLSLYLLVFHIMPLFQ